MASEQDWRTVARIIRIERRETKHIIAGATDREVLLALAALARTAISLADYFAAASPRFNRTEFLERCDVRDISIPV